MSFNAAISKNKNPDGEAERVIFRFLACFREKRCIYIYEMANLNHFLVSASILRLTKTGFCATLP